MKQAQLKKLHQDQSGLVSIIVTIIFVAVITVITLSFVLIMRREQRQSLDRQLNTQAFYAAESGINDAVAKLKSGTLSDITDCSNTESVIGGPNNLTTDGVLKYTCVLINQSPTSLEYSAIDTNQSTVVPIIGPTGSGSIKSIKISWHDADGGNTFVPGSNTDHLLPGANVTDPRTDPLRAANGTGILRATLMPLVTPITRSNLINDARTYFLYPKDGGIGPGTTQAYSGTTPMFVDGDCNTANTPKYCNATISNLGSTGTTTFYLRLRSIYRRSSVTITAYDSSGNAVALRGAQAVVDSTGRANDVLRRVLVRVPITTSYLYPEFALGTTDSICKRLVAWPGGATVGMPPAGNSTNTIDYDQAIDTQTCSITN